jgi:hypothetical protein
VGDEARRLQVDLPWPVVLVAPVLAVTPVLVAWATLATFGSLANLVAATAKAIDRSSVAGPAAALAGLATVAELVVVGVAAVDSARQRGGLAPWLAPATAVAVGVVLTPVALFAGSGWLAPRAAGRGDAAKLFDALRIACEHSGRWLLAGLVVGAVAAGIAVRAGRIGPVERLVRQQLDAWRAAADESRPDPEAWRR